MYVLCSSAGWRLVCSVLRVQPAMRRRLTLTRMNLLVMGPEGGALPRLIGRGVRNTAQFSTA